MRPLVPKQRADWKMTKRQGEEDADFLRKKKDLQDSCIEVGFIEAMDKYRAECVNCSEKLGNENMKP